MVELHPQLYRQNEVCEILRVRVDTLRRRVKTVPGFPQPVKIGNSRQSPVYYKAEDIHNWVKQQEYT